MQHFPWCKKLLRFWQRYEIKPTHDASIAAMVPLQSERLLRYEASLERSIDRTLAQLERLQRMALVPPTLKVELSR